MDDTAKRKFFYSFWYNHNNVEPQKAWEDYKIQVKRIDRLFGTKIRKGYQTDRGRVYLKYGAPNNLIDRPNEPSTTLIKFGIITDLEDSTTKDLYSIFLT